MENQYMEAYDCYLQVDQMINEGLGGCRIYDEYDFKKYELKQVPKHLEASESGDHKWV